MSVKLGLIMAVTTVLLHSAPAGEERRLVGYANGTPMYLNGAAPVRRVASGPIVQGGGPRIVGAPVQRVAVTAARTQYYQNSAPRVRIGSTGCSYGIPQRRGGYGAHNFGLNGEFGGYNGYTGYPGYGLPNSYNLGACNYGGGYGWGNGRGNNCGAYTQPYPAAASRGYSWIPRYGSTTAIPRYPH